jgi:hypothetical protein
MDRPATEEGGCAATKTRASSRSADQLGVDQGGDRPHRRGALGEIAIVDADPESPLELVDELDGT